MKLQFKEQQFQLDAVAAVVDCFQGQARRETTYTLERRKVLLEKTRQLAAGGVQASLLEGELLQAIGYRNAPLSLTEADILANIRAVQRRQDLLESAKIEQPKGVHLGYNLTIEMETGTGKTYTYIRTMYALHKAYGWSKFMVIVPSIAIREGVHASFADMKDHFLEVFGHQINAYLYNSARPQDIESFAADSRISVMVINTQAFNASGADARRIHQELDQFSTRRPIDILAETSPILIIDEPQSVDGEKTLKGMQDFKPLFTLRYSATHKVEYNKVFRLDALDAYARRLVKKIQVKGVSLKGSTGTGGYLYLEEISLSTARPPYAVVEFEKRATDGVRRVRRKLEQGADLYQLSGNMPAYKNQVLTEINGYLNKIVVGGIEVFPGEILNDTNELAFRRIQIRETIRSHMHKEKQLFARGIKVLSLFFIDSVDKYRVYNEAGEQVPGDYARIFEEEYNAVRNEFLDLFAQEYSDFLREADPSKVHKGYMPGNFGQYLQRDEAARVHEGYFAVDKKNRLVDPTTKRGSEDSDDVSAYDLIMKDKKRLLSFEEPTRFIFSHSALREGWDNPNVFQICALKPAEGGSTTRRRQEVGRGMRLCVDLRGLRQDFETISDQVHEVNRLTIVASESYEAFAKGLQAEIAATLKNRPQKANAVYFVGKVVKNAAGVQHRITDDEAQKLTKYLFKHNLIDEDDKITDEGRARVADNDIPLPEALLPYRESILALLKAVYTDGVLLSENERDTVVVPLNKNYHKEAFQALWRKISLKTVYEVKFDTEQLIHDSRDRINTDLQVGDLRYEVRTGELQDGTKEQLELGLLVKEQERRSHTLNRAELTDIAYDLVGEIEALTHLTRRTVVAILKAIHPEKFLLVRKNPEAFIARCSNLINEVKASLIYNNIVYHKTDAAYDAHTVFTNDKSALRTADLLQKHIYDHLVTDSGVEKAFAQALEKSTEVVVYAKLPKTFYVSTPVANYSPDWAIVFDQARVRHIYFVAETKGSESNTDLREIEKLKIHCAHKHFEALNGDEEPALRITFAKVSSYEKLLEIIQHT